MRQNKKPFCVAGVFDTETTTLGKGADCAAFPCVYIVNDLRGVEIENYEPNTGECITFLRYSGEFLEWIDDIIDEYIPLGVTPVICAYNLSFDIHTLMVELNKKYEMEVLAQSRTGYYCVDLIQAGERVLRFWDTFYLEMGGLAAMGDTCGFAKAYGDWDYSLIRHQETPLTEEEKNYCRRDVQIIPAYLRWLLEANPHLKSADLGHRCITKTSVVRLLGQRTIGALPQNKSTVFRNFELLANSEKPPTFERYVLRKVAFRGGLTFTSGKCASQVFENVASFDVVSMHHLFINGRMIPVKFHEISTEWLGTWFLREVRETKTADVLENYEKPFQFAFHIRFRARGVRLKKGSVFEALGIGTLPASKFEKLSEKEELEYAEDYRNVLLENSSKIHGDKQKKGVFAFSKLIMAEEIIVTLSELEYWIFEQVYEYDSLEFVYGEATSAFIYPPPYVSGLSNMLFEQKECLKNVLKDYREGEKYYGDTDILPDSISEGIQAGVLEYSFLEKYYKSTIKGAFNSIYGIMAMDVYKPDFEVEDGDVEILKATLPNPDNFEERTPQNMKVLYTYGMRIVGGSRLHLILAILLIHEKLGERARVLGGDTDSIKVHLVDCSEEDVLEALAPLHETSKAALDRAQKRIRERFPEYASDLKNIGVFEHEYTNPLHIELWNKGRVVWTGEKMKVTLAGVPRPKGMNIEKCLEAYATKYSAREALERAVGYNTALTSSVSRFLSVKRPGTKERINQVVTDYLGSSAQVDEYQAIALYENTKEIGSTLAAVNRQNVAFLRANGVDVDTSDKRFRYFNDIIYFSYNEIEEAL